MIRMTVLILLQVAAGMAAAAPFAPEPLRIDAPHWLGYAFDGRPLTILLKLEGRPATVTLALFTKDRARDILNIRSGHLGWHYVNRVDTCFYVSPPYSCVPGMSTIVWDGKDADGRTVPAGEFTYYLWGIDTESPPQNAARDPRFFRFDHSTVVMYDGLGNPLANPILFSAARSIASSGETWNTRARWVLGGDPDDSALIETTRYRSHPDRGRMALNPTDSRLFFTQAPIPGWVETRTWEWISNGDAVLRTSWGDGGSAAVSSPLNPDTTPYSGPTAIRDFLFSSGLAPGEVNPFSTLDCLDINDGALVKRFDLSPWFGTDSVPSAVSSGSDGFLLSAPGSALFLMVNPVIPLDDEALFVTWENGVGDGFADTLPASARFRGTAMDREKFAFVTANDPAPSIGVFVPDGTGAGTFSLSGLAGGMVNGATVIDSGSSLDGLYYGGVNSEGDSTGVWYTGYDVFKGNLGSADHFGPPVFFTFASPAQAFQPGSTFILTWEYFWGESSDQLVRISVSLDNRQTWTVLADSATAWGSLEWTVPAVSTSSCWFSLTDINDLNPWDTRGPFTIEGPVSASDATPAPFALRPNTPNPFNPSTTLSFTLPAPGNVSLTVYDITGRKVTELARGFFSAGEHSTVWNAEGCASGVYFAVLKVGERTKTRKMLLVR